MDLGSTNSTFHVIKIFPSPSFGEKVRIFSKVRFLIGVAFDYRHLLRLEMIFRVNLKVLIDFIGVV